MYLITWHCTHAWVVDYQLQWRVVLTCLFINILVYDFNPGTQTLQEWVVLSLSSARHLAKQTCRKSQRSYKNQWQSSNNKWMRLGVSLFPTRGDWKEQEIFPALAWSIPDNILQWPNYPEDQQFKYISQEYNIVLHHSQPDSIGMAIRNLNLADQLNRYSSICSFTNN